MRPLRTLLLLIALSAVWAVAQPLGPRAVANLEAFTRVSGVVFYFHPSDQVTSTTWEAWTARMARFVPTVEAAETPQELAGALRQAFAPLAPTAEFHPTAGAGDRQALPDPASRPPEDATRVLFRVYMPSVRVRDRGSAGRLFWRGDSRFGVLLQAGEVPRVAEAQPYVGVLRRLGAEDVRVRVPSPAEPYVLDLPGGVTARIPLAVYGTRTETFPRQATSAPPQQPEVVPADPRSVRIATVMRAWNVMQHFFPYWDVIDTDWPQALRSALRRAAVDSGDEAFLETLRRLMHHLHDGHSSTYYARLITPEGILRPPFQADMIEGQVVITRLERDANLPITPGDMILEIDGVPARDALHAMLEQVSPVGQAGTMRALARLLGNARGDASLHLRIDPHAGGAPYEVEIARTARPSNHLREYRPAPVAELAPGILYVDLTRVDDDRFDAVLERLQEAHGIVFDLRGRPSGMFTTRLLDYLSPAPLVFDTYYLPLVAGPDGTATQLIRSSETWSTPAPPDEQLTPRRTFITNGNGSVSFPESILSLIETYDLGERVGQPSGGANGAFAQLHLPNGFYTSWTADKVTRFDGSPLFARGIPPTTPAIRTIDGVAARRDELLERAYEVLTGADVDTMRIRAIPEQEH